MINWTIQKELRDTFLSFPKRSELDYWKSAEYLRQYDLTFGKRIHWKWEAILQELFALGFEISKTTTVLDWGCGSGIAIETLLSRFSPKLFSKLFVFDRSQAALNYAIQKLKSDAAPIETWNGEPYNLLLLSHVLNEASDLESIADLIRSADHVIWLEPGTPFSSEKLIQIRETFRDQFQVLAPCPHQNSCGLTHRPSRHWCHFYLPPSAEVFHSSFWKTWSEKMQIDLRSLTVSYLVLSKSGPNPISQSRILGRPKLQTRSIQLTLCEPETIRELSLPKKTSRPLLKQIKKNVFPLETPQNSFRSVTDFTASHNSPNK